MLTTPQDPSCHYNSISSRRDGSTAVREAAAVVAVVFVVVVVVVVVENTKMQPMHVWFKPADVINMS
jgi:hypothetical protein